jgi:glutaredoxin
MDRTIVWTQEGCPLCERVKEALSDEGFEERHAEELLSGDDPDVEAMAQLAMQNMELPLVQRGDVFLDPHDVLTGRAGEAA